MRKLAHLMVVFVLALVLLGAGDGNARFTELGNKMMCKCGCNQVLLQCNHVGCTVSTRMIGELRAALERGENDDLILQGFVQQYGATVLSAPTTTGFNRVAWIMPFAAFFIGLATVVLIVRNWRFRPAPLTAPNPVPTRADALRQRARQETEI
jgi:cytochrome c-type biogenesis protein CcmH/NrfF